MKKFCLALSLLITMLITANAFSQDNLEIFNPVNKSLSSSIALLDSLVSVGDEVELKYNFTYNGNGYLSEYYAKIRDTGQTEWINLSYNTYVYDDKNNRLLSKSQNWNGDLEQWVDAIMYTYLYDENDNRTRFAKLLWDDDQQVWTHEYQWLHTYDEVGNDTLAFKQVWDIISLSWKNDYQSISEYDVSGNKTLMVTQSWDADLQDWVYTNGYTYEYDDVGNLITYVISNRHSSNSYWIRSGKYEYLYLTAGKLTHEYYYSYDQVEMDWRMASLTNYSYSAFNGLLFLISKQKNNWETSSATWTNYDHFSYTRDEDGNLLSELYELWNVDSEAWENVDRENYDYDAGGNRIHFTAEDWDGAQWITGSESCVIDNYATEFSFYCEELNAYYSSHTGLVDENGIQVKEFTLHQNYPNPFNPTTAISYQLSSASRVDLSIYNVLGQKVVTLVSEQQPAGQHHINWDASGFTSGVYFYRLKTETHSQMRKMMLIK